LYVAPGYLKGVTKLYFLPLSLRYKKLKGEVMYSEKQRSFWDNTSNL